ETSEKNAGSSLYSRLTTSHIETPWRRMSAGSTRSSRSFSQSCRILSCSRRGGSRGGIGGAAEATPDPSASAAASAAARGSRRVNSGAPLLDFPGVARAQECAQVARALLPHHLGDLLRHPVLVHGRLDRAQHADRRGEARRRVHAREQERVGGVRVLLVVDDEVLLGRPVAERHDLELEALHAQALVAVLAEHERLSVLEPDP